MGFFSKLFGVKPVKVASSVAGMRAIPLVATQHVGPADGAAVGIDKIEHAKYRLNAIKRNLDQNGHELTAAHKTEHRMEVRDHVNTLIKAGEMTEAEGDALIKTGGA